MIATTSLLGSVDSSGNANGRESRAATARQHAAYDAQLVQRFNGGEDAAFDEIVARYRGKMFSVAFSLLRNRADAEEIAQDTFIRAHRGLARFRGDSSLATWLHHIALNLSRNRHWYFFRRHRHATSSFDSALGNNAKTTFADLVASDAPDPAREAANNEFSALITVCMGRLSFRQNEILTMRNVLNRSYDEIAGTLGVSLGTVKSRIARARKSLRAHLSETHPEFAPDASPFEWFEPSRPSGYLDVVSA